MFQSVITCILTNPTVEPPCLLFIPSNSELCVSRSVFLIHSIIELQQRYIPGCFHGWVSSLDALIMVHFNALIVVHFNVLLSLRIIRIITYCKHLGGTYATLWTKYIYNVHCHVYRPIIDYIDKEFSITCLHMRLLNVKFS